MVAPLLILLLALLSSFMFYAFQLYSWHLEQQGATRFFQQSFKSSISQYEYLPALLAQDSLIKTALSYTHQQRASLNEHLLFVAERSGPSDVYVMNISGEVIATSNYLKSNSFLNQNYSFRPYFVKAISQRKRQFYYAIGATTGIPGFFISEPVIGQGGMLLGVVVVKLSLTEWERSWQETGQNILLADDNNVVILSGQPQWRYRTLGKLQKNTLQEITNQRQFQNEKLDRLYSEKSEFVRFSWFTISFWNIDDNSYLVNEFSITDSGWTLYYLEKNSRFVQSAIIFFIIFLTGLVLIYLYLSERKSKLLSRLQAEDEIKRVNASLEEKVQSRTKALSDAQEELVQQSKVAALGQMAATIVHELSQPLSAMNSSIVAIRLKAEKSDWKGAMASISRLAPLNQKMNGVIQLLKSFSYQDDKLINSPQLAPLIEKSLMLYKDNLKERNVRIKQLDLQNSVTVKVNPLKLDLVIVNIIQNAVDAMEKCEQPEISVIMKAVDEFAVIEIEDIGGGVDSRVMGQLFNPYFTTKEVGKGLGLGLSICHEIIREYGGSIEVENLSQGARFIIKLPLSD